MNKKFIKIAILTGIIILTLIVVYVISVGRQNSQNIGTNDSNTIESENQFLTQPDSDISDSSYIPDDYSQYEVGAVINSGLKSRLKLDKEFSEIDYVYSTNNKIAFRYELKSIIDKKLIYVRVVNNRIYLSMLEDNIKSGQSIEVINIDPNIRLSSIEDIITQQILIADEKVGCKIEEKNGRYSIKPKNSIQTCGNYADINNKFFVKPTENSTATTKLIFVNAGNQELSYDGSGKGRYWYESVIVE